MKQQALKYEIIEWITQTNDSSVLKVLKSIKDSNLTSSDWFDNLNPEEKESINRGLDDHERGDVLTSKQFWAKNGGQV